MPSKDILAASAFLVAVQIPGAYLGVITGWKAMDKIKKSGEPFNEAAYLHEFDLVARQFPGPVQWVSIAGHRRLSSGAKTDTACLQRFRCLNFTSRGAIRTHVEIQTRS